MRFRQLIPAVILALPVTTMVAKGKTPELTGNWKETKRWTAKSEEVSFTDTVRIDFLMGNEYVWQKDMGYAYRGTYKTTDKALDMGARYFTIASVTPVKMVLKSEDGASYEFTKYKKVVPPPSNSSASSTARAADEAVAQGTVDKSQLSGKWETFKRTSAVTQEKIDYTRLIKSVDIHLNGDKMNGAAYAAQRTPETGSWNIDRFEDNTIYTTGTDKRDFKILKCSNGELVLQEGTMTYFFKVFK